LSNATIDSKQAHANHHVHFYDDGGTFIYEAVAEFLAEGFRAGEPVIFISTIEHRNGLVERLDRLGVSVQDATADRKLQWLDARETLSSFMVGNTPDPALFRKFFGGALDQMRVGREHLPIRAFGEMVDLLMCDGNPDGAVCLEELWNQLGQTHGFSLWCAYNIGNLYREEHWRYFKKICDQHAPLLQAENGTPCPGSGMFKSVCCGTEVIIDQGMTFPDCPNHPRLSTVWKRVKEKDNRKVAQKPFVPHHDLTLKTKSA
jgi:hypothetical protein